jgi:putative ABC transport system substrate-binding protein
MRCLDPRRLIGSLVIAAALALPLATGTPAGAAPFRIMIVLWRGCEDACRGFEDYIHSLAVPVELLIRDVEQDRSALPGLVAEARALKLDLVVTWGTTATLGIAGRYDDVDPRINLTEIPVLFMIVADPVAAHVVADLDKPGRNVSGTLYLAPADLQIQAIRSYYPFKKIGMIYSTDEVNGVLSIEAMAAAARRQGIDLATRRVPDGADGKPSGDSLPEIVEELAEAGVDLIYPSPNTFMVLHRDVLTNAALKHHIPVAAGTEAVVIDSNALLGLVAGYYDVGRLTGMEAERILVYHRRPADIPIKGLSRFSFLVNMAVARELGLYPPMSIIKIITVTNRPAGP